MKKFFVLVIVTIAILAVAQTTLAEPTIKNCENNNDCLSVQVVRGIEDPNNVTIIVKRTQDAQGALVEVTIHPNGKDGYNFSHKFTSVSGESIKVESCDTGEKYNKLIQTHMKED